MNRPNLAVPALAIVTLVLLSACAAPTQTRLADGSIAYQIRCEGVPSGLNYCFERAGKSCGAQGYTIVGRDGSIISKSDAAESESQTQARSELEGQTSILVKCGT